MRKRKTKIINVNELREILKKEFNCNFCFIDGIEVVTKGRSLYSPEYIKIGSGRILNIHIDLGEEESQGEHNE